MHKHATAGFTLLEVLISIVIIAFGLLGIAGLQAFALKNNQSASYRLTATTLAADIIDRMKANVTGVSSGAYDAPTVTPYDAGTIGACLAGGCTPAQMAQHDLAEWSAKVKAALPGGKALVCLDSTPADGTGHGGAATSGCDGNGFVGYAVKIWWSDDRNVVAKDAKGVATGAQQLFWTAFNP